jgi:hypothetical protein
LGFSWMPTPVAPELSQCAEMLRIAVGRGSALPHSTRRRVNAFSRMAFMGLPWPMKMTGMRLVGLPALAAAAWAYDDREASAAVAPSAVEFRRKPRRPGSAEDMISRE